MVDKPGLRKVHLRIAQQSDLDFLLKLRKSTMNIHLTNMGLPTDEQSHLNRIKYQFAAAKIITMNEQDIGLLKSYQDDNALHIVQIQIIPELQNNGVGAKLVQEIIQKAKHPQKKVMLSVLKSNPVKKLYDKLGFHVIKEEENSLIMCFEHKTNTRSL